MGYDFDQKYPALYVFMILILVAIAGVITLIFGFTIDLHRMLKKSENKNSDKTIKMQRMIIKVIVLQTFDAIILFSIPLVGFLLLFLSRVSFANPKMPLLSLSIFSGVDIHPFTNYFLLVYYVKPYRRWVKKQLGKFVGIFKVRNSTNVISLQSNIQRPQTAFVHRK